MKAYLLKLAKRIDAMSLRERALIFFMAMAVVVALVDTSLIDPLRKKQANLARQMQEDQAKSAAIHAQVQSILQLGGDDPDRANRERLKQLQQDIATNDEALRGMQKGLVPPDRIAALLGDILRRDGRLQLVSLKTLPASSILEMDGLKEKAAANPAASKSGPGGVLPGAPMVYKHGVVLVVRGSYAELLGYLARLEGLSWQMFWGNVDLRVEEFPHTTLTLTLYTLSLDKTWLSL